MSEKNISPQPAEPKKGQKNTRRYTRKPKQNKGTDALSQAVQSAIEFVKEPLSPRGKKAQAEEKKPQKKNNQKQAEKLERKNEGGAQQTQRRRRSSGKKQTVRIVPLGGLNEIGKNMTVYECGNDMFIVDCGLAFPDETMLGVDIVIPDFTYVVENRDRIRGVFITHGHEDHIGGIPYLMKEINAPIYATKLTVGLIKNKLKEHGLVNQVRMVEVKPGDVIKAGCMSVEFIRVNHSIPDACALAIHTPAGVIVQTGDFKVDFTPIEGGVIDLGRFGELGSQGVLALLPDSTNIEMPGSTRASGRLANRSTSCSRWRATAELSSPPSLQHPPHPADHRLCGQVRQEGFGLRPQHGERGGDRHRAGLPQGAKRHPGRHRRGQPPAV